MLETVSSWLSPFVHWLSQWMPHWVASILVYGVPCILIGIPLSEGWAILRRRWWNRLGHNESRLLLLLAFGAALLYSRGHVTMDANLKLAGLLMLAGAAGVVAYSVIVRGIRMPITSSRWETRTETAPGFPVITWRQDVDTGLQQKHVRNAIELNLLVGWIIGCVALGWI